jgi:putative ABC transport system permease protein
VASLGNAQERFVSTALLEARDDPARRPEQAPAKGGLALRPRILAGMLAFLDMKDDALLSACLVCAVAAVLAPIMILAGLKFGYVENARNKLIQNPSFRLITPTEAQLRPDAFFTKLRARDDVAFVQPNVNLSGTTVRIAGASSERSEPFDVMPTGEGDPLIVENEGQVPAAGEVTLTERGAQALGVGIGQDVQLFAFRSLAGRRESQRVPLKVRSILRPGADAQQRGYVSLDLVQDIENYKAGIPVARRGWLGPATPPQQSFDAADLVLETALDEVELYMLCGRYAFADCPEIPLDQVRNWQSPSGAPAAQVVHFTNLNKTLRGQQLADMISSLGDRNFELRPIASDLRVIPWGTGEAIRVRAGMAEGWPRWRVDASFAQVNRALIPVALAESLSLSPGDHLRLGVIPKSEDDATHSLTISVIVHQTTDGDEIVLHPALVGMLLHARQARLAFDDALGTLIAADIGFRSFRLYAKTIDDVPTIVRDLGQDHVSAKHEIISELHRLDAALTRIILLIAGVALIGGTAALIANIYAAVERKRADLSLLRLLGFSRGGIFSFPILQCMMLAAAGYLVAVALFLVFAGVINQYYAGDLGIEGNVCRLAVGHLTIFALATFSVAALSSLVAAHRTTQIDPAEALRHE